MIVEADKPVPRVATIGFEFKLQLNRQRYGQLYRQQSCTDSKLAAATKSKELKLKFELNCDRPAMT